MWRYARALDTGDGTAYAATYTVDGQFGAGANATKGREALKKMVDALKEQQAAAKAQRRAGAASAVSHGNQHLDRVHRQGPRQLSRVLPDGQRRRRSKRAAAYRCRRPQRQSPRTRERQVADQGARRGAAGLKHGATVTGCVLMFSASFLLLASVYDALPAELPVLRVPIANLIMEVPKSACTVFRVPLMNLTHGLMAGVMLSHANDFDDEGRRASYTALFSTLLFAIALKSNFEALEIGGLAIPLGSLAYWLTAGTALSVAGGLALALVRGRNVRLPWTELQLSLLDKLILAGLFASYLVVVAATLIISHRI